MMNIVMIMQISIFLTMYKTCIQISDGSGNKNGDKLCKSSSSPAGQEIGLLYPSNVRVIILTVFFPFANH